MKQQTRLVALLLALVFCLSMLSGCQKKDDENKNNNDDQQNQDEQKEIVLNTDYTDNGVVLREPAYADDLLGTGAMGANGAASCASELASQMAVELMKKGGNAVDAAVFMIYAVGLLEPSASGIGGAGQLLIYLAEEDKYVVVEYMTQAGEKAIPGTLEVSRNGKISPQCIAIPGIVHGTLTALEKYGNLSPKEVLQPLVELARNGWEVTERWNQLAEGSYEELSVYPYSLNLFTNEGTLYNVGDTITNPDYADTLELIINEGIKGFYDSDFTDKMVNFIQEQGGILTRKDFAQYTSVIREPISTTYRGYNVYTVGGPSNGGATVLEALNICENFDLASYGHDSWQAQQIIADAFALAYADGMRFLADPDYYNLPIADMTSKEYAKTRSQQIQLGKIIEGAKSGDLEVTESDIQKAVKATYTKDQGGTTHIVATDSYGNYVSTTDTVGVSFGSKLAVPGTGFVFSAHLNNLTNSKGAVINKLQPYIRVRSTTCPTIVADSNNKPVMAIGSPGDWALVAADYNGILNYIEFGMNAAQAVLAPRTWRDGISKALNTEGRFSYDTLYGLAKAGFSVEIQPNAYGQGLGCLAAIEKRDDGNYYAIGDYRRLYGSAAY